MNKFVPVEAFPPGDFLLEELEVRGWTQTEFAKMIDRPFRLVNEIIAGKRAITPETAHDFAGAFGTSAQLWMNLETAGERQMKTASWIIRNKTTREVICETFSPAFVAAINTTKYEVVPILEYLQSLNNRA